jgi:hypothetical protein
MYVGFVMADNFIVKACKPSSELQDPELGDCAAFLLPVYSIWGSENWAKIDWDTSRLGRQGVRVKF